MKFIFYSLITLVCMATCTATKAQTESYEYLFNKNDKLITKVDYFGSFQHHHQEFFNKAFSYQGVEAGVVLNKKVSAGLFFSSFASNLIVNLQAQKMFVTAWRTGLFAGSVQHSGKVLHTGWQVYAGYFSLKADQQELKTFGNSYQDLWVSGMLLIPEVYAELNILKWFKFRTGLDYSFYSFENQTEINKSNLNSIGLNFGFIFHHASH
jgi:hypothetical protein